MERHSEPPYQINISKLHLHAYHGVFAEENQLGQHFSIDIMLELKWSPKIEEDKIEGLVSYAEVIEITKKVFCENQFKTIEKAAFEILKSYEVWKQLSNASITINKPSAPVPHKTENISVTLSRKYFS